MPISPDYVREVIKTDKDDAVLNSMIAVATTLLNTKSLAPTKALGETLVIEITRCLSAHFLSQADSTVVLDERISKRKIGNAEIDYTTNPDEAFNLKQVSAGAGILSSRWGRVAASLDTTGSLASLGGRGPVLATI